MGGSLIKQYKAEVERAEQAREAKEAKETKEAALAEAKRSAEAAEHSKSHSSSVSRSGVSGNGRASAHDADVHMSDAESLPLRLLSKLPLPLHPPRQPLRLHPPPLSLQRPSRPCLRSLQERRIQRATGTRSIRTKISDPSGMVS